MTLLTLNLLGRFEICIDAKPVTDFHSDKARALLSYLALEPQQHARRELAALFWPDVDDKYALTNLRNTLHRLRRTLDTAMPKLSDELLTVTRQTVQIDLDHVTIDAHRVLTLLDSHRSKDDTAGTDTARLAEAISLYRGELLSGFGVTDAPAYEEWLLLRRELLHQRAILAFHALASTYESSGQHEQAHAVASRLPTLDPYREDSYRLIMRLLAAMGQPDQALRHFEQMRQLFQADMSVPPSQQTLELAKQIAAGKIVNVEERKSVSEPESFLASQQQPPPLAKRPGLASAQAGGKEWGGVDLSEVPDPGPFFGRAREREQLLTWIQRDRCRIVAILGIGGMGKTSLAAQCVRELTSEPDDIPFGHILWRSLLNAPPLTELLTPLLQILSNQQLSGTPQNLDEQLRLFISYLREERVLLVLDNLESILQPERAGAFRPGYEPYAQLLQQVATLQHQSHLLFTSRERPRGFARLEGDSQLVHSLPLDGLDDEAGQQLLLQRGVHGEENQEATLIARYSGNPLALKLVADTVEEIFGGDIEEFLAEESLVFDDIRTVLDQHFARLSLLEQELLFWLAVNREPLTVPDLRRSLLNTPPQRALLEALRNLQRRSLVERSQDGFLLQNVVTEYLTDRLVEQVIREIITGDIDLLHRHALIKTRAKEYVRESQVRLILQPAAETLVAQIDPQELGIHFRQLLSELRMSLGDEHSYAGGTLLNLLLHLHIDLSAFDFSQLSVWQVDLRNQTVRGANFANADLSHCTFTQTFSRIEAVTLSADGTWLAAGGDGGEIRLFDLDKGQPYLLLEGHTNTITSLRISPDGTQLASTSDDGMLRLWHIKGGQPIHVLDCQSALRDVAFSSDGTLIAGSGRDGTVWLWETQTYSLLQTLREHSQRVNALAFHPTKQIVASAGYDGAIYQWDVTGRSSSGDKSPTGEAFDRDAHIDNPLASVVIRDEDSRFFALDFNHAGTLLAAGCGDGTVRIWDCATNQLLQTLHGHNGVVQTLVFGTEDAYLYSASVNGAIRQWDTHTMRCVQTLNAHEEAVHSLALSSDGSVLASGSEDGTICLWDVSTPEHGTLVQRLYGYPQALECVAWSPCGRWLATGDIHGSARIWDLHQSAPNCTLEIPGDSTVISIDFSADGKHLIFGRYGPQEYARIWQLDSDNRWRERRGHHIHTSGVVRFSSTGGLIASCDEKGEIFLWDAGKLAPHDLHHRLTGHESYVNRVSFSAGVDSARDTVLASCSDDLTIRIWDLSTGEEIRQLPGYGNNPFVVINSQGTLLACSGPNSTVAIWSLDGQEHKEPLHHLRGHSNEVFSCAFSPDGKQLVTASLDRTVRLWDVESGDEITMLGRHDQYALDVAFDPEGELVASAGKEGTVRIWQLATGKCLHVLPSPGPYEGMNITGVTGITDAQKAALKTLGAAEIG